MKKFIALLIGVLVTSVCFAQSNQIIIRARGTMGGENLELRVNDNLVDSWSMTTSYQDFTASGSGEVEVRFTNDDQVQNGMDIQVDYINYHGTILQAEDQETNTGVYVNGSCGGSYSDMLQCNGYILFDTSSIPSGSGILGDVNGNETIDIIDALITAQYSVGLNPEGFKANQADVNCDGTINIIDALQIAQYYVGILTQFSCPTITPTPGVTRTPTSGITRTPTPGPTGSACQVPAMPSYSSLPNISELPDPFKFMDGTRMTRKDQWACRRAEISALYQQFIIGAKPPKPSSVTGSYSGGKITVTCSEGGKTISFSCSITLPSGTGPFPAMIGIGGASIGSLSGVASISFPNDEIAAQGGIGTRGQGKFYDLYGSGHSAGALIAWGWGVSRLIDALEQTPSANIDTTKLGVTGCSRNGKGALVVGAFDERIALTIPQESGCGGASSWRVADYRKSQGANIQTLCQIIGENPWLGKALDQFCNNSNKLPVDSHELIAMCAPRAVLVIGNNIDWLGPQSVFTASKAAHFVFEALGIPDNMGYSISGNHGHCSLPSSQAPEVNAFVTKFMKGGSANTAITRDDNNFTFDKTRWAPWSVPTLQ